MKRDAEILKTLKFKPETCLYTQYAYDPIHSVDYKYEPKPQVQISDYFDQVL